MDFFQEIDSLIFDLDGTLWDASATCAKAWNETFAAAGLGEHIVNEETVRSFSGLRVDHVFRHYFSFINDADRGHFLQRYEETEATFMRHLGGELYPGVKDCLHELAKRFKLFIVSNCLSGYIENFIRFTELEHVFTDFECSGNTGLSKEDNIRQLIHRNKLTRTLYVGDTAWDHEAAIGNQIPFVFASYGFGKAPDALYKIGGFSELLFLLPR